MHDVVVSNQIAARLTVRAVMDRISNRIGKSLLAIIKRSCKRLVPALMERLKFKLPKSIDDVGSLRTSIELAMAEVSQMKGGLMYMLSEAVSDWLFPPPTSQLTVL